MQIDKQQEGRRARLCISGELTIYAAAELHRTLLDSLGACDRLELDLGAVTELDTSGLQQLVLLCREAKATGKSLHIEHGDATREVLALCRLDAYFADPEPTVALPSRRTTAPGEARE